MHDLACVVHVHSTFSDGTATVPEIIDATRRAGADAVLIRAHVDRQQPGLPPRAGGLWREWSAAPRATRWTAHGRARSSGWGQ